ncbi:mechanosensitive ion channel family protein [Clostridium tarantellae]|uniref:Mechanosensitive ion channel n=1 Tax=Clostridium tarantellae TaxID=39493 RepID=A0A6I1MKF3_9CLOT|nr:mechanosensitive ion channel family protein [Clostridium tarantellae]MPQ42662.1 mechanosensitive ion channel [Clostridium tarantellae]
MCELENLINKILHIPISEVIISVLIIFCFIIINRFFITNLFKFLNKLVNRTNNFIDNNIIKALERPLKFFILFCGIYYSFKIINLDALNLSLISTAKLMKMALTISISYFIYNLTLENSILYAKMNKTNERNTIFFPFISIIIRLIIVIICISIIAKEFGFTGFITGLGISGVAFALAAQDTCSNLFGGMVIVLDKPFAIGDWIQTSEVEGIVEEITFRSTKIRTFSMALATVPNSKLANNHIINWTQRKLRRIHFKFTIEHDTPIDSIKKCINDIENMLKNNEKVDKDLIIVSFNELSTYGFGIFIYFYTKEFNYVSYEKMKQEINISILEILRDEKIKLMFLNLNFTGIENRGAFCEAECTELESIKNITEEERGT